jgi:hypothetical protein
MTFAKGFSELLFDGVYCKGAQLPLVTFDHTRQDIITSGLELDAETELALQSRLEDLAIYPNPRAVRTIRKNGETLYKLNSYGAESIRQLRVLSVDLDGNDENATEKIAKAKQIAKQNNLPEFTGALVTSKKHVTMLWAINDAPLIGMYNRIAKMLAKTFASLGADPANSADKMLRLPGSINKKTGDKVSYIALTPVNRFNLIKVSKSCKPVINVINPKKNVQNVYITAYNHNYSTSGDFGNYDGYNKKMLTAFYNLMRSRGGVPTGMRNNAYRQAMSLYAWTKSQTATMRQQVEYFRQQVEANSEALATYKQAIRDVETNGARPFNKQKCIDIFEITPNELQQFKVLAVSTKCHHEPYKPRKRRRVQLTEVVDKLREVTKEAGIFTTSTASTNELNQLTYADGHDHRKTIKRAITIILDEFRKHAKETLAKSRKIMAELVAIIKQVFSDNFTPVELDELVTGIVANYPRGAPRELTKKNEKRT